MLFKRIDTQEIKKRGLTVEKPKPEKPKEKPKEEPKQKKK